MVLKMYKQVKPRILLTIDRFRHNKEETLMLHKVKEIANELTSLDKVIVVPSKPESRSKDISDIRNSCFLDDFLELGRADDGTVPPMEFEQVDFSHPVFIDYTSGTKGWPKPVVHGTGALFSICRDFSIQMNIKRESIVLSMSMVGWVSWNNCATSHQAGITVVMYEGVPYFLSKTSIWDMIDEFKITDLHVKPFILSDLEKKGYVPTEKHSLESLKSCFSGGCVVENNIYDFVYNEIKKGMIYSSRYGSTESMGSCMIFDRSLPVYRGELQCLSLGVDLECLDDSGKSVIGERGELVITKPIPSLPLGLWGDDDGSKFKETYFKKFTNKFAIGDLGLINPVTKGVIIYCRSDELIKPRGCQFGCSEIYNIVNILPDVDDSICTSQYSKNGNERAVLFIKMRNGHTLDDELIRRIQKLIADELSVLHVPDVIRETKGIPHSFSGKKMEITVKKLINNMPYNADIVKNKDSLDHFRNVPPYLD